MSNVQRQCPFRICGRQLHTQTIMKPTMPSFRKRAPRLAPASLNTMQENIIPPNPSLPQSRQNSLFTTTAACFRRTSSLISGSPIRWPGHATAAVLPIADTERILHARLIYHWDAHILITSSASTFVKPYVDPSSAFDKLHGLNSDVLMLMTACQSVLSPFQPFR